MDGTQRLMEPAPIRVLVAFRTLGETPVRIADATQSIQLMHLNQLLYLTS
jgi:hypothetical protein